MPRRAKDPEPPVEPPAAHFPSGRPGAIRQITAIWPILTSLAVGAGATWGWIETQVDRRVQTALKAHDREVDQAAHPSIQTRLETLETWGADRLKEEAVLRTRLSIEEAQLRELYWFQVGDKAAELERDPALRAQTAAAARERFRLYTRDGDSFKDAYRRALEARPPRW